MLPTPLFSDDRAIIRNVRNQAAIVRGVHDDRVSARRDVARTDADVAPTKMRSICQFSSGYDVKRSGPRNQECSPHVRDSVTRFCRERAAATTGVTASPTIDVSSEASASFEITRWLSSLRYETAHRLALSVFDRTSFCTFTFIFHRDVFFTFVHGRRRRIDLIVCQPFENLRFPFSPSPLVEPDRCRSNKRSLFFSPSLSPSIFPCNFNGYKKRAGDALQLPSNTRAEFI